MGDNKGTCQICGGMYKINPNGILAHHGFKRPGWGFQTASCMGARYEPYEVSRDRIPAVIEMFESSIARMEEHIEKLLANPPDTLEYHNGGAWSKQTQSVHRPNDFVPTRKMPYSFADKYGMAFYDIIKQNEGSIKVGRLMIDEMQQRYDNWHLV